MKDMLSRGKTVEEIVDFSNYSYELVKGIEEKYNIKDYSAVLI